MWHFLHFINETWNTWHATCSIQVIHNLYHTFPSGATSHSMHWTKFPGLPHITCVILQLEVAGLQRARLKPPRTNYKTSATLVIRLCNIPESEEKSAPPATDKAVNPLDKIQNRRSRMVETEQYSIAIWAHSDSIIDAGLSAIRLPFVMCVRARASSGSGHFQVPRFGSFCFRNVPLC